MIEQTSVDIKQEMEGKILSLSHQLREREEEVKQLSTDIKGTYNITMTSFVIINNYITDLRFRNEKNKSLEEMSDKTASIYSSLVKEVPPPDSSKPNLVILSLYHKLFILS